MRSDRNNCGSSDPEEDIQRMYNEKDSGRGDKTFFRGVATSVFLGALAGIFLSATYSFFYNSKYFKKQRDDSSVPMVNYNERERMGILEDDFIRMNKSTFPFCVEGTNWNGYIRCKDGKKEIFVKDSEGYVVPFNEGRSVFSKELKRRKLSKQMIEEAVKDYNCSR